MTESEIFKAAVDLPNAERGNYLDRVCGTDRRLRDDVESLLRAHHAPDGPLQGFDDVRDRTAAYEPLTEGPGTRVGPYKLLQEIGEGGMGTVFMAEQEEPVRRKVALKIIKPGMDSKQVVARFEAERQALSMMDHPNIARVLDAGTTASGRPYFVMELVHGVPITEFCDANKLTPQERLALFVPICQAIQHAHMKGIIHRDIKPSNVLVTMYDDKPVPKVIDFGVAKAVEQRLTEKTLFTQYGALVGTFEYMSPEQAEMNAFGVDTRSDVYSLGVLLYELLTGSTPLERQRLRTAALGEVVRLIREEEPPRPSQRLSTSGMLAKVAAARKTDPSKLAGLVRGELDWIVMRCLEKDRTRRYESATGLAKDVQRYLTGDAVEACPPTLGYRLKKAYRRNRAVVLVASAFVLLVTCGAVIASVLAVQATRAERAAEANAEEAMVARNAEAIRRAEAERLGDDLRRTSYLTSINLAAASLELGEIGRTQELLDRTRSMSGERDDLRGWEWHYLRRATQGEQAKFGELSVAAQAVAFSPDGHYLAVAASREFSSQNEPLQVRIWDRRTGREKYPPLTFEIQNAASVAFSPDGRVVTVLGYYYVRGSAEKTRLEVRTWDAATGRQLWKREVKGVYSTKLRYSPDGKKLAVLAHDYNEEVTRVLTLLSETGAIDSDESQPGKSSFGTLAFTAKGALTVAMVGNEEVVYLRPQATKAETKVLFDAAAEKTGVYSIEFNPLGTHVAVITGDRQLRIWDLTGPKPILTGLVRVDSARPTTKLALSPDGQSIAQLLGYYGNPLVGVWDVATGKQKSVLRGHTNRVLDVVFSPDGRTLATASADRTARTWYMPSSITWEAGPLTQLIADAVASGPDGRFSVLTRTFDSQENITAFAVSDIETGRVRFPSPPRDKRLDRSFLFPNLQLSPDSSRVAASSWVAEDRVQVWDIATGRVVAKLPADGLPGERAWFGTPDQLVVGHKDFALELWDLTTGARVKRFTNPTDTASTTTTTPDGRFLAAYTRDRALWVWDVTTGELIQSMREAVPQTNALALRSDGLVMATGGFDGQILLWEVRTGRLLRTIAGHAAGVRQILFSPDGGRRLFSRGNEGLVKMWDTGTGQELITFRHNEMIRGIALSPDGHRLATVQHPFDGGQIFDATPLPDPPKK